MHKRLIVIVMSVAILVLAANVTGYLVPTATAQVLEIIAGNIQNDGQDYVGRIIVITDPTPSSADHCGVTYNDYKCVIIGGGSVTIAVCGVDQGLIVNPGDRFDIITQEECDGRLDLTMTPK